ncbi:hypothetical protein [Aquibium microcysteis]|uniref:hypothetical protein n=1 Tax=Aquibium microcysteis TaxID=675281 RepID=UPI00165CEFFA|nr:hypothetical protein [Aquibium microcysteis]
MGGSRGDGRKLRRIIATLVALAGLADAAAGRAHPVRWLVLFFLRRGERVALDHVAWELGVKPAVLAAELAPAAGPGDAGPMDAVLMAWRLRWLAMVLGALLERSGGRDRVPGRTACGPGTGALTLERAPVLPPRAPDTS